MLKKIKDDVKRSLIHGKILMVKVFAAIYVLLASGTKSYAFQGSIYETGTKKMAGDLLKVGQGVAPVITLALCAFWEIQKRLGEENEEGKYSKKQKTAFVGLIVIETIGVLVGIVGGYYGVTVSV